MQVVPLKGRGSLSNRVSRFQAYTRHAVSDDWAWPRGTLEDAATPADVHNVVQAVVTDPPTVRPVTTVSLETARSIISRNTSPDIPFDQSINTYRGCEHGCIYCYARPSHAYLDLSPGLDFETRLYAKQNAAQVLRTELSRPGYEPKLIAMGTNTDPYQPIEKRLRLTASLLEVFDEYNHPVSLTTKSALITRDIPILARLARRNLVRVLISIGTLDRELARRMEPRAATPAARLDTIRELKQAGIPVGVIIAPVVPGLTDHDLERVAIAAQQAGATDASYVVLRLPREVSGLFREWLQAHYPMKAAHVMNLVRAMRNGKDYDPDYRQRMAGGGVYADMLRQRFHRICTRTGLNRRRRELDSSAFQVPGRASQLALF
ncbi:MAG TPA: PA0069 family radical SAM protein [Burkholderiaceae bacterium]|nr:PA0069 family radical SAM protein [Burkholderiaceae bacterium]